MGREESWFTTGEKLPGEFEWVLGGGGWVGSGLNYTERGRGRGGGGQEMRALDFLEMLMRYVNQGVGRDVVEIFERVLNFSSLKDIRCGV